jgi:pimeloyl-ACP methyl ester carboxylesterase
VSDVVTFPGARAPDRRRTVVSHGIRLAVHEWGAADAPPLMLAHGGFDFARTYDVFAPLLADAGWRVVSWDQRGHGDSEHAAMYSWDADLRDALAVIDSVTSEPVPVIGHSKGGAVMVQFAAALPHRLRCLVNLDGLPGGGSMPDVSDRERTKLLAGELAGWLDFRHDADGWRWKIDPALRLGGFGPWRPEWAMARLPGVGVPMLAAVGRQPEMMGWATPVDVIERHLPPDSRLVVLEDLGHFVHIEAPERVAALALEFLKGLS